MGEQIAFGMPRAPSEGHGETHSAQQSASSNDILLGPRRQEDLYPPIKLRNTHQTRGCGQVARPLV